MKLERKERRKADLGRQTSDPRPQTSDLRCDAAVKNFIASLLQTPAGGETRRHSWPDAGASSLDTSLSNIFIPQIRVLADEIAHELNALGIVEHG